ncbi:ABC transporter permease [Enterocloster bolteae]|uniref:ABC transporter permease n=1 Tax=Enterocloster bolteae TaxID=208479 RepID=UPI0026761DBC|nr:ABC transporter permease subunit [Enterocloster bolteae]
MERTEMKKRKSFITNMILALLCASILIPAASLVVWVFTERWAWPALFPQVLSDRAVMEIVRRKGELVSLMASSVMISSVVAVLAAVIGILTSRVLVLYRFRGKDLMSFLTVLPLMVPGTVFAMGIQITFIRLGLNNTVAGVILAHLIYSLPYAVRLIMDGTRAVGIGLEEQARVLGAGSFQAFRRTTLPMLVPVILSAVSMSYIVSFSQYFLTLLLGGGRVKTFAVVMVPYLQSGSRNIACVYSILFMGITLLVFAVFERIAVYWTGQIVGGYYES